MYELLLVAAVVLFIALKYRETFVVKYGNPFNDEDLLSFDSDAKGKRLFGITPDTCPANKSELDAGLCYEQCDEGYHGVGPVCWADTVNIGIGKIPRIEWYQADVTSWGSVGCTKGRPFRWGGYDDCYSYTIWKAKQVCDDGRDLQSGLCYNKCPPGLKRVPGIDFLCFKGGRGLSYGRGVGDVPPIFAFGE